MAVPLPDAVIRALLLVESDAHVVVADGHGLAGVGAEAVGVAGEDEADDLLLEPGLLLGEEGLVAVVFGSVVVFVVVVGEGGGVEEEEIFEGFMGKEWVVVMVGRANLEPTHQGLEEEVVQVCVGVHERAHFFLAVVFWVLEG